MAPHVSDASLPTRPIVLRDLVMAYHSVFLFTSSPFSQVKSGLNKYQVGTGKDNCDEEYTAAEEWGSQWVGLSGRHSG